MILAALVGSLVVGVPAGPAEADPPWEEAYVAAVLADEPVSYWRMEGTTFTDEMGNYDGTISGDVTLGSAPIMGTGAALFEDGVATIDVPIGSETGEGTLSPDEFSLEFWIDGTAGGTSVIDNRTEPGGYQVGVRGDCMSCLSVVVDFEDSESNSTVQSAESWDDLHVVVTLDYSELKIYAGGELVDSAPRVGDTIGYGLPGSLTLGPVGGVRLDEVAIYDRALSASRIAHHAELGGTAVSDGLRWDVIRALFGHQRNSPMTGDPVNAATGNYTAESVDLDFESSSSIEWTRTYNSLDPHVSGLGRGWAHSYSEEVVEQGDGSVELTEADGRRVVFEPDGVGAWLRPEGVAGQLAQRSDDSYAIEWFDGGAYEFDTTGRLEEVSTASGEEIAIEHATSSSELVSVSSSWGPSLSFTYLGGLLSEVSADDGRSIVYGYDGDFLESVTDAVGRETTFESDAVGRIERELDPASVLVVENQYDEFDRVLEQRNAQNTVTTFSYNDVALVTTVHDSATDSTVQYEFDERGRVVSVEDPFGQVLQRPDYDSNGNLGAVVTRLGATQSATYNSFDQLLSVDDPSTGTTTYAYDSSHRLASKVEPNGTPSGATTTYCYDIAAPPFDNCYGSNGGNRIPTRVTDDLGHHTTITVSDGLVTSVTDPDGVRSTYEYTSDRRVQVATAIGDPGTSSDDAVTRYDYCEVTGGEVVQVTSPRGTATTDPGDVGPCEADATPAVPGQMMTDDFVTQTFSDDAGRVLWEQGPDDTVGSADGPLTTNEYDSDTGQLLQVNEPDGGYTRYEYDPDTGEVAEEFRPGPSGSGVTEAVTQHEVSFDATTDREIRTTIDPNGAETRTVIGPLGRIEEVREQTQGAAGGDLPSATDSFRVTTYTYDHDGNVQTTTTAAGTSAAATTRNDHDSYGRLQQTCDEVGRRTYYSYDAVGRLESETGPWDDDPQSNACADPIEPLSSLAPFKSYEYDDLGRQTAVILATSDTGVERIETSYTPAGRTDTTTDAAGLLTTRQYDDFGRLELTTAPGASGQRTVASGYDRDGNATTSTNGEDETTTTTYDPAGRPETVTTPAGVTTTRTFTLRGALDTEQVEGQGQVDYDYDASGALVEVEDALGNPTSYEYTPTGQRATQTNALGKTRSWTYFDDGQVLEYTDERARSTTYTYDPIGRLSTVSDPSQRTVTSTYDASGFETGRQHTQITGGSTLTENHSFTPDPAGRRATMTDPTGTSAWTYDRAGRTVSIARGDGRRTAYTYDEGRRTSITHPDGTRLDYTYDDTTGRLEAITPHYTIADSFSTLVYAPFDTDRWTQTNGIIARKAADNLQVLAPGTNFVVLTADTGQVQDVDAVFSHSVSAGTLFAQIRQTSASRYRLDLPSTGSTGVVLKRIVGTTTTVLGSVALPSGTGELRTRVRADGDDLSLRVWRASDPEPSTWGLQVTDSSPILNAGLFRWTLTPPTGAQGSAILDDVQLSDLANPPDAVVQYGYDNADRTTTEALPDGTRTRDYADGQLEQYVQNLTGTADDFDVALDYHSDHGLLEEEAVAGAGTTSYGYDDAGQLTTATDSAGPDYTWSYDSLGRRATRTVGSDTRYYRYDDVSSLCHMSETSQSSTVYGSACPASLPAGPWDGTLLTYDEVGRRRIQSTWSDDITPSGGVSERYDYSYGVTGRRSSTLSENDVNWSEASVRRYDGDGVLLGLTTNQATAVPPASGTTSRPVDLSWDTEAPVSRLLEVDYRTSQTDYIGTGGPWAATVDGTAATTIASDQRGTPLDVDADPMGDVPGHGDRMDPIIGYRGEIQLGHLTYLRNRDYDPATGQFTTRDPLAGIEGTPTIANPYHYADNDPINRIDPLGLQPTDDELTCPAGEVPESTPGNPSLGPGFDLGTTQCQEPSRGPDFLALVFPFCRTELANRLPDAVAIGQYTACIRIASNTPLADSASSGIALASLRGPAQLDIGCGESPGGWKVACLHFATTGVPAWKVNPSAEGYTQGHFIFCKARCDGALLIHELVHVEQWEDDGDNFALLYAVEAARYGTYCDNKYERQAYLTSGECSKIEPRR